MKRDMDLIRQIMKAIEELPAEGPFTSFQLQDCGKDSREIMEHVALLVRSGYLEAICEPEYNRMIIQRITWVGHDFLDAARDDEVWQEAKTRLKKIGSFTFAIVLEVLKDEAKKRLGRLISE